NSKLRTRLEVTLGCRPSMQPRPGFKEFLCSIPIFGGLNDKTLDRVVGFLVESKFPVGATVCKEGDTGRSMYVVGDGEVIVCRNGPAGNLVRMMRMGKGEFFGEMMMIDMQPRAATVIVEQPATLYALTNKDLYALYQQDVEGYVMVLQNICRELSRRLRSAN